jgi:hypothetical protein
LFLIFVIPIPIVTAHALNVEASKTLSPDIAPVGDPQKESRVVWLAKYILVPNGAKNDIIIQGLKYLRTDYFASALWRDAVHMSEVIFPNISDRRVLLQFRQLRKLQIVPGHECGGLPVILHIQTKKLQTSFVFEVPTASYVRTLHIDRIFGAIPRIPSDASSGDPKKNGGDAKNESEKRNWVFACAVPNYREPLPPGFRYFMIGTKTIGGIVVLIIVFFPSWPEADPDQTDNKAKRESDGDS